MEGIEKTEIGKMREERKEVRDKMVGECNRSREVGEEMSGE